MPKVRKLNVGLLRRLARKLRRLRHEEHYDQGSYFQKTTCGTAACIAGYAALEAGWKPDWDSMGPYDDFGPPQWKKGGPGKRFVVDVAMELLGLPSGRRDLFTANPERDWPSEYAERWNRADPDGPPAQRPSRVAADLLDALADGKVEPF